MKNDKEQTPFPTKWEKSCDEAKDVQRYDEGGGTVEMFGPREGNHGHQRHQEGHSVQGTLNGFDDL